MSLSKFGQLLALGRLVDAVDERPLLLGDELGHRLVRGDHELFYDALREEALGPQDVFYAPFHIEDQVRLGKVESRLPCVLPPVLEQHGKLAHLLQARHQGLDRASCLRVFLDQGVLHLPVCEPRRAFNDGPVEGRLHEAALRVVPQSGRHRHSFFVRVEAANDVRELLGEHRYDGAGEVDARPSLSASMSRGEPGRT